MTDATSTQKMTPLTEVRKHLSEIVDEVSETGSTVVITKYGRPVAVLLGFDSYEGLIETINILSDPVETEKLAEAERDVVNGNFVSFEEVFGDEV